MSEETVPPFAYPVHDPIAKRTFYVFSYLEIKEFDELRHYVATWMGKRRRKMPKNFDNLPNQVCLVVERNGRIRSHRLPTQQQLKIEEKEQNRRKKALEKWRRSGQHSFRPNRHDNRVNSIKLIPYFTCESSDLMPLFGF